MKLEANSPEKAMKTTVRMMRKTTKGYLELFWFIFISVRKGQFAVQPPHSGF